MEREEGQRYVEFGEYETSRSLDTIRMLEMRVTGEENVASWVSRHTPRLL
jgi:hypothetical protein